MRACSASICALDQATQGGSVGIVAAMKWYEPLTNSTDDILAARRAQAFETDWYVYMSPVSSAPHHKKCAQLRRTPLYMLSGFTTTIYI
jgi:beta-glucosidase/6-phospho-beta-glucosidase/beta-galactosidase